MTLLKLVNEFVTSLLKLKQAEQNPKPTKQELKAKISKRICKTWNYQSSMEMWKFAKSQLSDKVRKAKMSKTVSTG